jgi:hypothetical protein
MMLPPGSLHLAQRDDLRGDVVLFGHQPRPHPIKQFALGHQFAGNGSKRSNSRRDTGIEGAGR